MNREILFRGKDGLGLWVEGFVIQDDFSGNIDANKLSSMMAYVLVGGKIGIISVHSKTVGQFTGYRDKNRVKIFDGDILKSNLKSVQKVIRKPFVVVWDNDSCTYKVKVFLKNKKTPLFRSITLMRLKSLEVIGNIHDNPELLDAK